MSICTLEVQRCLREENVKIHLFKIFYKCDVFLVKLSISGLEKQPHFTKIFFIIF